MIGGYWSLSPNNGALSIELLGNGRPATKFRLGLLSPVLRLLSPVLGLVMTLVAGLKALLIGELGTDPRGEILDTTGEALGNPLLMTGNVFGNPLAMIGDALGNDGNCGGNPDG